MTFSHRAVYEKVVIHHDFQMASCCMVACNSKHTSGIELGQVDCCRTRMLEDVCKHTPDVDSEHQNHWAMNILKSLQLRYDVLPVMSGRGW